MILKILFVAQVLLVDLLGLPILDKTNQSIVLAQATTCAVAVKATPPGPFPCSVTVAWQDSQNETSYRLERRLNAGPWVQIGGTIAANTTSVIDATLQQSQTTDNLYEYKVSAVNNAGTTPGTSPIAASFTIPMAVSPPTSPTGITVTFKGASGEMLCPTCSGGDKKVPLGNDDGTFVITSAAGITVDIKY